MDQRQREYFGSLFNLLKEAAFHQIYMQSAREDLCKDDYFDPLTAFKSIDSFKHNKFIPYELYSFFEVHQIESTIEECEQIVKCLNKSLSFIQYESFLQLTMPKNTVLKNLSLTRFNDVKIEIGSYSKLNYVKQHTQHCIALFLQKQLNFCRYFLFLKQQFCRKWGGDIYTVLQIVFKDHKKSKKIAFEQFCQISRVYGILFNKDEFQSIRKRSKSRSITLQELIQPIYLQFDDLSNLLLVSNFKTKALYGLEKNIAIKESQKQPQPSYRANKWRQYQSWKQQTKGEQMKKLKQQCQVQPSYLKYRFSYPQLMVRGGFQDFKHKRNELISRVDNMNDRQLLQNYHKVAFKSTIFRQ